MSCNGPKIAAALGALVAWGPALPCMAGDSYLDRSKVQEAIPYGGTIAPPPAREKAEPAAPHAPQRTTPPGGATPSTLAPDPAQGRRDQGTRQPR